MRIAHQKWKVRKSIVTFQNRKKEKLQKGSRKLNPASPFFSLSFSSPDKPSFLYNRKQTQFLPPFLLTPHLTPKKKTLLLFPFFSHPESQLQMPILLFLLSSCQPERPTPLFPFLMAIYSHPCSLEAWLPTRPAACPNMGWSGVSMADQPLKRGLPAGYGVTAL